MDDMTNAVFVSAPNLGSDAIQVYDALTGTILHNYKGLSAVPSSLTITGPDNVVLCGSKDRAMIQAWPLHQHNTITARLSLPGRVAALAVAPTPPTTVVAAIGEALHVYNLESGSRLALINRHYQPVTSLAFFPCGNYFASSGEDGFVYIWSMASIYSNDGSQNIQPYHQLGQHSDKVTQVYVSGGVEGRLVSASSDNTARVYDLTTLSLLHTIVCSSELTCVAFNNLATRLVLGTATGHIALMDLSPHNTRDTIRIREEQQQNACHTGAVVNVSVLVSGSTVVSAGEDGEVKVWVAEEDTSAQAVIGDEEGKDGQTKLKRLAHQRTIHKGKGTVTNMMVRVINRKLLSGECEAAEQQFQSLQSSLPFLETAVTVAARTQRHCSHLSQSRVDHMRQWSSQHASGQWESYQFLLGNL